MGRSKEIVDIRYDSLFCRAMLHIFGCCQNLVDKENLE